jgi:phosphatidylglycerophosphate synthase
MPPQQRRGKGSPSPARKHKAKAKSLAPAGSSVTCWGVTLEADQVESLRGYKYCCDNKSVLCNSWICIAFWEWIAQRVIPMSMTPNAVSFCVFLSHVHFKPLSRGCPPALAQVTILGAMCSYSVFICGHLFQPAMTTDSEAFWWLDGGEKSVSVIDSWTPETKLTSPYSLVCITGMGLLVLYNTLDNVDGKVARNRGMGSPLGQWMDHGCDSLTMCLALCVLCNLMQLTGPWMLALFVVGSWVWLGVAWEEHYTHCLRMDYFCSDESEYFCVALGCYTLYAGPQIWTATVKSLLFLSPM